MKSIFLFSLFSAGIALFYGLGSYGLLNNNEGLYAEVAREMLVSGNWIIPHLNGVPYIEKPPLLYWLLACSFSLFGVSEFSARLVTASAGFGLLWILWDFTRKALDRETANRSFLMLGTSLGFVVFARMVYFDVLFAFFLTMTLILAYRWYESEKKFFLWGAYAALGLGILTKGFVALACVGVVGSLFFILEKPGWRKVRRCFSLRGTLLLLAITVPWHVAASLQHEGFAWWYFINEHVLRFLGLREPKDYYSGTWYYYLIRLPLYIFPWTFWLPLLIQKIKRDRLMNFIWAWLGGTLLFFSLSEAKANYYMVVGLPPLILWLSICFSKRWENFGSVRRKAFYATSLFLVFLIPIGLHGAIWWAQSQDKNFHPDEFESLRSVAPKIQSLCPDQPLFFYREFENLSSLPFYLKRSIPILDSTSKDLWYAQHHGGYSRFFPTFNHLKNLSSACVVVRKGQVRNFERQSSSLGLKIKRLWAPYAFNLKGSRKVAVLFHVSSPYAKVILN